MRQIAYALAADGVSGDEPFLCGVIDSIEDWMSY
jgi:hypothetical protein